MTNLKHADIATIREQIIDNAQFACTAARSIYTRQTTFKIVTKHEHPRYSANVAVLPAGKLFIGGSKAKTLEDAYFHLLQASSELVEKLGEYSMDAPYRNDGLIPFSGGLFCVDVAEGIGFDSDKTIDKVLDGKSS